MYNPIYSTRGDLSRVRARTSKSTCSTSTYSTTVHVQVPQLYCIFDCLFLTVYFWLFYFWLFIFDRDSTLKSPSPCLKIWVWRAVFGCWRPRWIAVWHRARRAQLHENKFSYDCTYVPCLSHLASYSRSSYYWSSTMIVGLYSCTAVDRYYM